LVDPCALTALINTASSDPRIAFVGSKIYFHVRPNLIWYAGGSIELAKGGLTTHIGMNQIDTGQFDKISDVGYVTGCSLLASKEAIEDIGLIPEEYFLYFEETDWNLAAQKKGYRTVFSPASHVWHKYALTGEYKDRFIYYTFRNRVRIVMKYSPQYILKAFRVNWSLRKSYIIASPGRARTIRIISFLAHLDALLFRYGQAKWSMIR